VRRIGRWAVVVAAAAAATAGSYAGAAPGMDDLRAMAGEWVRVGEDGKATAEIASSWRVTSAGSAVIETLFPGTEHEMVTVYHEDGDAIALTHYCAMGNQPRMRSVAAAPPRTLEFACAGGSNMASENDAHMHHARLEWIDADHVRAVWTAEADGAVAHVVELDLVRRK